jgi:hypothetical protein
MFAHYFGGRYASDLVLSQAALSPSLGGLGLRYFQEYHLAAYAGSLIQCLPEMKEILPEDALLQLEREIEMLLNRLRHLCGGVLPSLQELEASEGKIQSVLSQAVDKSLLEKMLSSPSVSIRDKARLRGCSSRNASAWLAAAPNRKRGKHLDDQSLGLLLKYWLGVPIFSEISRCHCGSQLDAFGDHAIHCKGKGNIIRRHDHVRDIIYNFIQLAGIPVSKELVGYQAGQKDRVGDIVLPFGGSGLSTDTDCLYDVSILSSLYYDRLQISSERRESTAELAVKLKLKARKADREGMIETARGKLKFIPLGFEALGAFSKNAVNLVDHIAKEWSLKSGISHTIALQTIISKISMGIQRGNALCLVASSRASLLKDIDMGRVHPP